MKSFSSLNSEIGFELICGYELLPQQVESIDGLACLDRTALFSEVGTGKTTMSTAIAMLRDKGTTLVLVPPIIIPQWERWLQKFSDDVLRYQGAPKERTLMNLRAKWVIMSHAIFRKDFSRIAQDLEFQSLDIIVDEAHNLKSVASKLFQLVNKLSQNNSIQLLTGTPTNKPIDAYSYIKLKTPTLYRSLAHFESFYVADRDFFGTITEYKELDGLSEALALSSRKHTRADFGYKLEALYPDTTYELAPDHMKLYKKLVDEQLLLLDSGNKIDATSATRLYHALQQIIMQFDYFSENPENRSAGYDLLDNVLEDIGSAKLIVWCNYKRTNRAVTNYLISKGVRAVAAYSEVDANKAFKAFMEEPDVQVLVAQYQSAGAGLNAQGVCSEMLYLELSTNPSHMVQSSGRVCRLGQTKTPIIRVAVAKGTIQQGLMDKLLSNSDLVDRVERNITSLRSVLLGEG